MAPSSRVALIAKRDLLLDWPLIRRRRSRSSSSEEHSFLLLLLLLPESRRERWLRLRSIANMARCKPAAATKVHKGCARTAPPQHSGGCSQRCFRPNGLFSTEADQWPVGSPSRRAIGWIKSKVNWWRRFFFHESVQLIPICCQAGARPEERGEPRTRVAVTHTHTQRAATPPLYRPLRPFGTKLVAISGSIPGECSPARVTIKLDEETGPALHCERRKHSSPPYHIETPGD